MLTWESNNAMSNEIQFILYTMLNDEDKVQVVVKDETL